MTSTFVPRDDVGLYYVKYKKAISRPLLQAQASAANVIEGQTRFTFEVLSTTILQEALNQTTGLVARDIDVFVSALQKNFKRGRNASLENVNAKAVRDAQAEMVSAYKRLHEGKKPKAAGRAAKSRASGGKLGRALASPKMISYNSEGASLIDPGYLKRSGAPHWYRLNFGSGPRGRSETRPPGVFDLEIYGKPVAKISLKGNLADDGFFVPPGFFQDPNTGRPVKNGYNRLPRGIARKGVLSKASAGIRAQAQGPFYGGAEQARRGRDFFVARANISGARPRNTPKGGTFIGYYMIGARQTGAPSKGIMGSNYLDAGVRALAANLSRGWNNILREWVNEARGAKGKGPFRQELARRNLGTGAAGSAANRLKNVVLVSNRTAEQSWDQAAKAFSAEALRADKRARREAGLA